jgi:hypothetical protein
VQVRYRIAAFRTDRLRQYAEMMRVFRSAGFRRTRAEEADEEPDNPERTQMSGTVPAAGVPRLLAERHVESLLLVPHKAKLPAAKAPVRVDLLLASGLLPEQQRLLARQTARVLQGVGFQEAIGYDNRGHTRLLGRFPAGNLKALLADLSALPGADKQPAPFRTRSALRAAYARPDLPLPDPRLAPPALKRGQDKLSPDLRALLADAAAAGRPTRLEVLLALAPPARATTWMRPLALPNLAVEGRLGPLVSVLGVPKEHAVALAALPTVVAVRLPRLAESAPRAGAERAEKWEPLRASGLVRLHALGKRGKGTRLALIAGDFRGWEILKDRKERGTRLPDPVLIDLTAERSLDLRPDPFPAAPAEPLGPGTRCARTLLRAAPEVKLTLIRIDPAAPYMLETVARAINGEGYHSLSMDQRTTDLEADRSVLAERRDKLVEERRAVLDDFRDDEKLNKRREAYRKAQAQLDADEKAYQQRLSRYLKLQREVRRLKGVRLVACSLVWPDGYPVGGSSALSRYFDDRPFRAALWFQAAGDTRGQSWTGLFRDHDGDGVMEFAAPGQRLPKGAWTSELNFLGWRDRTGRAQQVLPAGARLRISLQWREAHDPMPVRVGEDPYRRPLAPLRLVLLYQPDPAGARRPADDFREVAQSAGLPQRLMLTLNAGTYEQEVDVRLPVAGRYAVRIEGRLPASTSPPGEAHLPGDRKFGELWPRLFVRTLEGPGRAVLTSFATAAGSVGMPADARRVITVGAADAAGREEPDSAGGPPAGLALLDKPNVLAFDEGAGTAEAACFAAGLVATSRSAGVGLYSFLRDLEVRPGGLLRVPPDWPRKRR